MKYLLVLPLLLATPSLAYTLVPDGNGGYTYGHGPDTTRLESIHSQGSTQTTIYRNNLPVQTCTTFRTAPGYSTTSCH